MKFERRFLVAVLCAQVTLGCSGEKTPGEETEEHGDIDAGELAPLEVTDECQWTFSSASAGPLDRLELNGPLPDFGEPFFRIVSEDSPIPAYASVDTSAIPWSITVPLTPDPWQGGTLELQMTDGARSCAPMTLRVEPLEPSERDGRAVLRSLRDTIEVELARAGVEPSRVADAVGAPGDEIAVHADDPEEVPILILGFLDAHPENPISFEALESRLTDEDFRLLAALVERHAVDTGATNQSLPTGLTAIGGCASVAEPIRTQEELSFAIINCGRPACNVVRAYDDRLLDGLNLTSTAAGSVAATAGKFWPSPRSASRRRSSPPASAQRIPNGSTRSWYARNRSRSKKISKGRNQSSDSRSSQSPGPRSTSPIDWSRESCKSSRSSRPAAV